MPRVAEPKVAEQLRPALFKFDRMIFSFSSKAICLFAAYLNRGGESWWVVQVCNRAAGVLGRFYQVQCLPAFVCVFFFFQKLENQPSVIQLEFFSC